jgi:hypothetical protein
LVKGTVTTTLEKPKKRASSFEVVTGGNRKIDLACGQAKREDFFGVDVMPTEEADALCDLRQFPWHVTRVGAGKSLWVPNDYFEEAHCSHYVEHTPMGDPDGLIQFMDELYRVCRDGAKVSIIHPYVKNDRAFWDPTHRRFIHEVTWYYFNREWREQQKLDHYPIQSNYEIVVVQGLGIEQGISLRNEQAQAFARQHYWNAVADLAVELKVVKTKEGT